MVVKVEVTDDPFISTWSVLSAAIVDGSVTIDRTAETRRTLNLSVAGFENPINPIDEFNPYGTFLRVSRGIQLPDLSIEYVPLGIFRVYETKLDKDSVEIVGYSLEADIRDARFPFPYVINRSLDPPSLAITQLDIIFDAFPTLDFTFENLAAWFDGNVSGLPNPDIESAVFEKDRLEALRTLNNAMGAEFSCTQEGKFRLNPPASPDDPPVWTVNAGTDGVLVEYSKTFSREGVYNGVVVTNDDVMGAMTNQATTPAPIRVLVVDSDVTSPTYWGGPFGRVPRFYSSSFIATRAQALTAGRAILARERGLKSTVDFSLIPNPALDVDDVVTVVYPDGSSENHLIDRLTVSLTPNGVMSAGTRGIQSTEEV